MENVKTYLKEWNAVIEALGQGLQTIIVRKYPTFINNFLLYPTSRYTLNDKFLDSFQDKYKPFVKNNALPNSKEKKLEIKYFIKCEGIVEIPYDKVGFLEDYSMWTSKHVQSYLDRKNAFVWLLRVFEISEPYMTKITLGLRYSKISKELSFDNLSLRPVIKEDAFNEIVSDILNKKEDF